MKRGRKFVVSHLQVKKYKILKSNNNQSEVKYETAIIEVHLQQKGDFVAVREESDSYLLYSGTSTAC